METNMAYDYEQVEHVQGVRNSSHSEQLARELRQRGLVCIEATDDAYFVRLGRHQLLVNEQELEAIYERVQTIYPDRDID